MPQIPRSEFGKPAYICGKYGFSRATLYRLMAANKIRAIKLGRATLIDVESVDAHLASLPPATFRQKAA